MFTSQSVSYPTLQYLKPKNRSEFGEATVAPLVTVYFSAIGALAALSSFCMCAVVCSSSVGGCGQPALQVSAARRTCAYLCGLLLQLLCKMLTATI